MTDGILVELAVSACEGCPVAALSSDTPIEAFCVDADDARVEFVASDLPENPPSALDIVEFAGEAHGRYEIGCGRAATDGGVAADGGVTADSEAAGPAAPSTAEGLCESCSCGGLPSAFAGFPVSPRRTEMEDGELRVSFVFAGHEELQAVVDECEAAGLAVELRRLCADRGNRDPTGGSRSDVVPVDLADVTDRQAEIAAVAAERGYFDGDGASAGAIADDLGLAKSTVSEHLRTVTDTLFSQTFGNDI